MSDERFDRDLTEVLREVAGEEAPMSLRNRLSDITERAPMSHRLWFATPLRLSMVAAAVVAVLALAIVFWPSTDVGPEPSDSPSPSPTVEPSRTPEPSATPTEEPTPITSPAPTPAPTPVPTSAWVGIDWSDPVVPFPRSTTSTHETGDELVETAIADVVPWNGGYVATGTIDRSIFGCGLIGEACVDEPPAPAFFTSDDARHWTVTNEFPMTTYDAAHAPQRLVVFGSRLLAFSRESIWTSEDGHAWTRFDSPAWTSTWQTTEAAAPRFISAAAGPTAVVAIGDDTTGSSIVVRSTDGVTWAAVTLPDMSNVVVRDVVAYPGGFVISGRAGQPDFMSVPADPEGPTMPVIQAGIGAPAAWVSRDGVTWSAASVEGTAVAGGAIEQVLVGTHGLYGVGFATSWSPGQGAWRFTHWWSTDGETWHQSGHLESDVPALPALASDGTNMIMLGPDPALDGEFAGWVSVDGRSWTRLAFTGSREVRADQWFEEINQLLHRARVVWVVPDGVVVNGQDYYDGLDDDTFWFGTAVGR